MDYEVDFGRWGTRFRDRILFGKGKLSIGETMVVARNYDPNLWSKVAIYALIIILVSITLEISAEYLGAESRRTSCIILFLIIWFGVSKELRAKSFRFDVPEVTFVSREGRSLRIFLILGGANVSRGYAMQFDTEDEARRAGEELWKKAAGHGFIERRKKSI